MLACSGLTLTPWTRMCSGQQHLKCCRASEMTAGWARLDVRFWEKTKVPHTVITCLLRCGKARSVYCAFTSDWAWWDQEATRWQLGLGHAFKHQNCYLDFFWLPLEVKFKPWSREIEVKLPSSIVFSTDRVKLCWRVRTGNPGTDSAGSYCGD